MRPAIVPLMRAWDAVVMNLSCGVWCKHPFAQRLSELKRNGGTAGADDEAEEAAGVCRRGE